MVGGGIHASLSIELLRVFVEKVKIPVVNSLLAVDALPYNNSLHVGMIRSHDFQKQKFNLSDKPSF